MFYLKKHVIQKYVLIYKSGWTNSQKQITEVCTAETYRFPITEKH